MGREGRAQRAVNFLFGHSFRAYERRAMTLLLVALAVDYAERTLIGALGPTLERVFHFGNTTLGLLAATSGIVAALATIPFGVLTDRISRTLLLAISLLIWAAAAGVTGASATIAMFFGARLLLGAVAAVTGPTVPSLTGDLVPASQRGRALGFIESGQLIGDGIGYVLAAVVTAFLSWRWCFWLLAISGVVMAFALWRIREPKRTGSAGPSCADAAEDADETEAEVKAEDVDVSDEKDTENEGGQDNEDNEHDERQETREQQLVREAGVEPSRRAILNEVPDEMSLWHAARYVLRVRTDVIVLVSRAIGDYFLAGVGTFGVIFATRQYGLSQGFADLAILGVGIGALLGYLLVGPLGDALLRHRHLNGRLWLGALGYIVAPLPLYPAFRTHAVIVALPLFAVGAFLIAGAGPLLDAVRVDVIVPRLRGRAEAVRQLLRTAAEAGAPAIFGVLSGTLAGGGDAGLRFAFIVMLPVLVVSGLILLLALRTYTHDVAAALATSEKLESRSSASSSGE